MWADAEEHVWHDMIDEVPFKFLRMLTNHLVEGESYAVGGAATGQETLP